MVPNLCTQAKIILALPLRKRYSDDDAGNIGKLKGKYGQSQQIKRGGGMTTLARQLRETDAQLASLQNAAIAAKTDIAALRAASHVAAQLYSEAIDSKNEAREAIVRALTQLREHAPGAAVETLESWLERDKAL